MNKGKESFRRLVLIIGIIVGMMAITALIFSGTNQNHKHPKIGYVLNGSSQDVGWNKQNYEGIKSACNMYECKLLVEENVMENSGECRKAVSRLIDKGASIIFLTSNSYADEIKDVILKNKRILFYSNHADFTAPNLITYFVKMYQVRYLSGLLAGYSTKTNKIGYIAAMDTPEVNRGISAFAMGVKRANSNAEVIVKWTGEWSNAEKEKNALNDLIQNENIDFVSYHVNEPDLVYYADQKGIKSVGYHIQITDAENCLTSIVCNWKIVYQNIISSVLSGRDSRKNFLWFGFEDGVVKLTDFSEKASNDAIIKVEAARSQILYGYNIFSGEIYDNKGELHCSKDEALSDKALLEDFNWLVEGVKIYE